LPGTLNDKIDPYLRPLYDALRDMMDAEMIPKLIEASIIEVAPLAYIRCRTLNDAFVILDEAQNTTAAQMKMFLTRLGFGSKSSSPAISRRWTCPRARFPGCAWCARSSITSTTCTFPTSVQATWSATSWLGASSVRTTNMTPLPAIWAIR